MAAIAMKIMTFLVLTFHAEQAVSQFDDGIEALSMIQKSAAIKRGKAQKGAAPAANAPIKVALEPSVPVQVLTEGMCSAQGAGTCSSNTKKKGTVKKATVKRAGGMKHAMPAPEADGADIFSDGIGAAVQFSQKSATVHRAKPSFQPPESSLDTSALGYERVSADVLAILREESGMLDEGISMVQKSASVQRVAVDADGHMPKLVDPVPQPQQPLAWEPVDPNLDIMSFIEEEEGIALVQKNVAAIRRTTKESSSASATSDQEGHSFVQVDAQYKFKQQVPHA